MCDGRQFRRYRRGTDVRGMDWLSNPDCEFARTVQRSSYQMRGSIEQYIPQIWIEWRRLGFQLPHTLAAKGNDLRVSLGDHRPCYSQPCLGCYVGSPSDWARPFSMPIFLVMIRMSLKTFR